MFDQIKIQVTECVDIKYGKEIQRFFNGCPDEVKALEEKLNECKAEFTAICDLFMFAKNDAEREKSEKFFEFWNNQITQVGKNLPKVEVMKKKKSAAPTTQKGGMSKEAMAKQNEEMKAMLAKRQQTTK